MPMLAVQPPPITPQADASALQEIFSRTAFGAVKAVIGSEHGFIRVVEKKIQVTNVKDKDGKPKEVTLKQDEFYQRPVRSLHQFGVYPRKWIALGEDLEAETEEELLALIYAKHGSPDAMRKSAKRVVYCAETLTEVDVYGMKDGKPIITREIALVSDREPG